MQTDTQNPGDNRPEFASD